MKKTILLLVALIVASASFAQLSIRNGLTKTSRSNPDFHTLSVARKTVTNIQAAAFAYTYYAEDNDWYCSLEDETGMIVFNFDIIADSLVPGTTYTLDDMLEEYTIGLDYNTFEYIEYDSASFTLSTVNGLTHVDARVVDINGNIYIITYDQFDPALALDTIQVSCAYADLADLTDEGIFQFMGESTDYMVYIAVNSSQVAGTYSANDINSTYTAIYDVDENEYAYRTGHLTVVATDGGYDLDAYIVCADSNCYHVTLSYLVPVAEDTIAVSFAADEVDLYDFSADQGIFQFVGDNGSHLLYLALNGYSVAGSYTTDDIMADYTGLLLINGRDTTDVTFVSGNIDIAATAGGYTVDAYLLFADNHCYHVTMVYDLGGTTEGIQSLSGAQVSVYPNPAANVVSIQAESLQQVTLLDMAGRTLLSQTDSTVNISALARGIYLLRVVDAHGTTLHKIVKE